RNVGTLEKDAAAQKPHHADDCKQERGFADAVAAEDRKASARGDVDRHTVENDGLAIARTHVLQFKQQISHGHYPDRLRARADLPELRRVLPPAICLRQPARLPAWRS